MDRIKVTLSRKVGPFTVGVWLIIIIAGVGIGLLVRKRLQPSIDPSGVAAPSDVDGGLPTGYYEGIVDGQAPITVTRTEKVVEIVDRIIERDREVEVDRAAVTGTDIPPIPAPGPPPNQPGTTRHPAGFWSILVDKGAIEGDPFYYYDARTGRGKAQETEYVHALRVADQALRNSGGGDRRTFWQRLVEGGHIQGDPTYYSEGRAGTAEYEHAYRVAGAHLAQTGGSF